MTKTAQTGKIYNKVGAFYILFGSIILGVLRFGVSHITLLEAFLTFSSYYLLSSGVCIFTAGLIIEKLPDYPMEKDQEKVRR